MSDPFDLQRFVDAQEADFDQACAELRAGRKQSHWIWYVFPQLRELGRSATAKRYGIGSLAEAEAYLAHPILGPRLRVATEAAMGSGETDPNRLFGSPDDMKFRSSMTLFSRAGPDIPVFREAIDNFYAGVPDSTTLQMLKQPRNENA
ncbi:DUF1810 domain-containing protein [Acuticoccus sp. M5D2P5]|uniref:DUF1810 domain-containing protein n=1 Tax=Acuticoccus kalidii TaxID=2910977 RepID=UPI001F36FCE1|nr:DUF1810 domain-containing protein [Acuticoccus kalidii]MCF3935981.1 DUF1810 domain-containing protein [Acuticoccus kalidii]